jgi:hypothetical protein
MRLAIGFGDIVVIYPVHRISSFPLDGSRCLLTAVFGIAMMDAGAQPLRRPEPRFGRTNFAKRCNAIAA